METEPVSSSLRRWFIVHFVADMLVAVPLFIAPKAILGLLGWPCVDVAMTRVVAAALFGIGIQSLLGRDDSKSAFLAMLRLKLIWSSFAIVGIFISLLQGAPKAAWGFLVVFIGFSAVWWRYWVQLRGRKSQ